MVCGVRYWLKMAFLCIGFIILAGGIFAGCSDPETEQGDWVYYANEDDGRKIYKVGIDGSEREKVNDDSSSGINVVGDWIYYTNIDDGGKIYRISTDGSGREKISNDRAQFINVAGDWIYYANADDDWSIYKISTDGSEREIISNETAQFINVVEGWIYYTDHYYGGNIYRVSTDGNRREKINSDTSRFINVVGDWIYYINTDDNETIYKIGVDGTEREKINDDSSSGISVIEYWIYYINIDDNETIYKIGVDGKEREKINDDSSYIINVVGEWIYYFNRDAWSTYKIGTDGSGREHLATFDVFLQKKHDATHVQIDFEESTIAFYYPSSLADGISARMQHGYFLYCPVFKLITFNNYLPSGTANFRANIELTPLEELLLKCDWAEEDIDYLKTFIANKVIPDNMQGPHYLPEGNAGQLFSVKVEFFETETVNGFRYITEFVQACNLADNLVYAYQGITSDQKYYFTARFGVYCSELTRHNEDYLETYFKSNGIETDFERWMEHYDDYVVLTAQTLNELDAEDFEPSLLLLDEIIKSFQIE